MTATVRPVGSGWKARTCATSNISGMVSTRTTPDCRNIASSASAGASMRRTVCPSGTPWVDRPLFTATTGLISATARESRENLRGLPSDSRYSSTTSVAASSRQYCSRSLPDTSARLPADTNVEIPRPRAAPSPRIALPSAPDWANRPIFPAGGSVVASDAFSE